MRMFKVDINSNYNKKKYIETCITQFNRELLLTTQICTHASNSFKYHFQFLFYSYILYFRAMNGKWETDVMQCQPWAILKMYIAFYI